VTFKDKISLLGYGWLGKPLYQSLIEKGFELQISSSTEQKNKVRKRLGLNSHLISLGSDFKVDERFFDSDILIIAIPPRPTIFFDRLIDILKRSRISKVLFVSSTSVYNITEGYATEESELGDSFLVEIETLFSTINYIETTIVRFGGLFGKDRHPSNFFKNKVVISNAGCHVNLIHQDDCVRILTTIILEETWGVTFNACAPSHPTKEQFYSLAFENRNMNVPKMEYGKAKGKKVSSKKMIEKLNYQFIHPDLISYWENH
jgi:nucleoside-diphosphate-sugar epimerase